MSTDIDFQKPSAIEEFAPLAEGVCPVKWARERVTGARLTSCGRSVGCRDGLTQLQTIVTDITTGAGQPGDLAMLRDIATYIAAMGDCEAALTAARGVLFSLDRYAAEWDAHCNRKRCAALVCTAYISVICLPDRCQGDTACLKACPVGAIAGGPGLIAVVDEARCTRCGACLTVCPQSAIAKSGPVKPRLPDAPIPVGSFATAGAAGVVRRRRRTE